jgi:hypothetical protein
MYHKNKNIVWFIACTYIITWILWFASFEVSGIFRIVGSFVPSIVGIVFICKSDKESEWKRLVRSVKGYQVKWYVYLFIVSYTILSFFIPYLLADIFRNQGAFQDVLISGRWISDVICTIFDPNRFHELDLHMAVSYRWEQSVNGYTISYDG